MLGASVNGISCDPTSPTSTMGKRRKAYGASTLRNTNTEPDRANIAARPTRETCLLLFMSYVARSVICVVVL